MTGEKSTWCVMPVMGAPDLTEAAIADVLAQSVPVCLLIVGQNLPKEFRSRLEAIAEQDGRIYCWFHEPALPSLSATWNRALRFVWECGGTEAIIANNDLRIHRQTVERLQQVMKRDDALFVSAVAVTREQFDALPEDLPEATGHGGPDFSFFLISKACHDLVQFDENYIPAYGEDVCYHREMMLAGEGQRIYSVNLPYWHFASGTLKSLNPEARAALERRLAQSRVYHERAWGGPINQERYTIKGDKATAQDGVTTPELQRALMGPPIDELCRRMLGEEAKHV